MEVFVIGLIVYLVLAGLAIIIITAGTRKPTPAFPRSSDSPTNLG